MKKYQAVFTVLVLAASVASAETTTSTTAPVTEASKQDTTRAAEVATPNTVAKKKARIVKKKQKAAEKIDAAAAANVAPAVDTASSDQLPTTVIETPVVTSQAAPIAVESSRTTVAPKFIDNVILSNNLYFYGPGVKQMDSTSPDAYSADGSALNDGTPSRVAFENIFTLGYRAVNDVAISANINHIFTPVGGKEMKDDVIKDPYLRVKASNLINQGGLNFAADLRAYFPVSASSVAKNQALSERSTQYLSYTVGRWTLTSTTYVRHFALRGDTGKSWELYAGPEIGFQISPNVSAALLYEMLTVHRKGTSGFSSQFTDGAGTDLEPSVTWQFTPAMSITPYLDIKTGGKVSWETTSVNFLFTANIL